ncbi:MAG: N-acetyltransferase family protein [Candidatus Planktophila sp.]
MLIRDAVESDISAITEIFNSVIDSSNSVYREERVPESERTAWFHEKRDHGFPIIVAEADGLVIGYGGYGTFRAAQGYRLTVEHTIHINEAHRGKGLGKTILAELIKRATDAGFHIMIGAIDSGNESSIKLHEKFGFTECARIKEVAIKHSQYLDLVFVEKFL